MRGRLSAEVPSSAKGFTVITPTGKAIDLGTKFGVDVPLQGEAEIHVFQGEVIAQSSVGGSRQSVRGGEAFRPANRVRGRHVNYVRQRSFCRTK